MAVIPEEFVSHMRESWREGLLAWRSLLDDWIEKVDQAEQRAKARGERSEAEAPAAESAPSDEVGGMANP
ncbi:MAG: hypothetical protein NTZ05_01290 [Chloroflexi bacterium]|nr:hypothetical protein [Chloroflexota bacterium]